MDNFYIGDIVLCLGDEPKGLKGTIISIDESLYCVQFEGWTNGHSGSVADESTDKWWLWSKEMYLIKEDTREVSRYSEVIRKIKQIDSKRKALGYKY